MYSLGVDLGTVYTAAATWENGHAEIVSLGSRSTTMPSVVLRREDGSFLTGESANRRALVEPLRVAREFKRRWGDVIPIMLGGSPHTPQSLMSRLLRSVVEEVTARQGEPPLTLCVCHPANWAAYKTDLLLDAIREAEVRVPVILAVEPVAAAAYYSRQQRVEVGALIGVYDLGGGTFDAAVIRKSGEESFEIVGHPEGIEHLGGSDLDAAVLGHVRTVVGEPLTSLDDEEPAAITAVARLRDECTAAKETLSSDTDTSIPVLLPNYTTEVRLTRSEFEQMIRPSLYETISSLQRAIRSAGVEPADLHSVLLIGGSSRIPLVAQLVGAEIGRPVAVDAHPKHAVALGAAWLASTRYSTEAALAATPVPVGVAPATAAPVTPAPEPAPAQESAISAEPAAPGDSMHAPPVAAASAPPVAAASAPPVAAASAAPESEPSATGEPVTAAAAADVDLPPTGSPPSGRPATGASWWSRYGATTGIAAAAVVIVATAAFVLSGTLGGAGETTTTTGAAAPTSPTASVSTAAAVTPSPSAADPLLVCPSNGTAARWACIDSATRNGGDITFTTRSNFTPSEVQDDEHQHLHVYLANPGANGTTNPPDSTIQTGPNAGTWYNIYGNVTGASLKRQELGGKRTAQDPSKYTLLCIRVANGLHGLALDKSGGFRTGNCVKLT